MLIAAVGIILSIIGIFAVRTNENATIKQLLKALAIGTNLSSVLIAISTFGILYVLGMENWFWIGCSVIVGLLVGIVIGQATEYYTSQSYKPTRLVSEAGLTGPATVIISGLGLGSSLRPSRYLPSWSVLFVPSCSPPDSTSRTWAWDYTESV